MAQVGDPNLYLPAPVPEAQIISLLQTLNLPHPASITAPSVSASYHRVYIISFVSPIKGYYDLLLRISGPHIPRLKTLNEIAILRWVAENTSIPVPKILNYDESTDNELGHEYMIMTKEVGVSGDKLYTRLKKNADEMNRVLDQIADIVLELEEKEWEFIGGLSLQKSISTMSKQETITSGPLLEEFLWQVPEIQKLWPDGETYDTVNTQGPFKSYVEYITGHITKHIHAINVHPSLSSFHYLIPRLQSFLEIINKQKAALNKTKYVLAHRDLHFGNILFDPATLKITSVIDWEFAGICPIQRTDPPRAFLWNADPAPDSVQEKYALRRAFHDRIKGTRGVDLEDGWRYTSPEQEMMQTVATFMRAIIEVCPRGQSEDKALEWARAVNDKIAVLESSSWASK
jgi:aminoglycoside phosphotransferase (APT) family kinase protein